MQLIHMTGCSLLLSMRKNSFMYTVDGSYQNFMTSDTVFHIFLSHHHCSVLTVHPELSPKQLVMFTFYGMDQVMLMQVFNSCS